MAHISEQVANYLIANGWNNNELAFAKCFPTGGQFGHAVVTLRLDDTGRWLERTNGWGEVEKDVDLRNYSDAKSAVEAVL